MIHVSDTRFNRHVAASLDGHVGQDGGDTILQLIDVVRTYRVGGEDVHALDGVSLTVRRGEFLAIMGRSGSGKSTLLNVIGCLDRPTSGTIILDGEDVTRAPKGRLPRVRREKIGFIFQQFNLIPTLTALENVMLPMEYAGVPERERREKALEALEAVGLSDRLNHRPTELSGGQQQRVAIARALVKQPKVLLADEPTGNLDESMRDEIMDVLERMWKELGLTFIMVTHDSAIARKAPRVATIRKGKLTVKENAGA